MSSEDDKLGRRKTTNIGVDLNAVRKTFDERFEDRGVLASGGMAEIRELYDRVLRRVVAKKVMHRDAQRDDTARRVFGEEAQITSQLDHPNIVPVHEMGRDGKGNPYFTMKRVDGHTLTEFIEEPDYSPSVAEYLQKVIDIIRKVADALSFAHDRGVIHRDLKPDNIMVGAFGQVYLMDFGVARVYGADERSARHEGIDLDFSKGTGSTKGTILGTLAYMSPEQILADDELIDERSDVFGLGGVLYFALTGRSPITGVDLREALTKARDAKIPLAQDVAPPGWNPPLGLCRIAMRALNADKQDRYENVAALKADIERFLRGGWRFPEKEYAAGETIVVEGQHGNVAYIILKGTCRVFQYRSQKQELRAELNPGDVFGEIAVFANQKRTATVQAKTAVTVLEVSKEVLYEELGVESFVGSFIKSLAARFVEADQKSRENDD